MMRKIIIILVLCVMCISLLTGCGGNVGNLNENASNAATSDKMIEISKAMSEAQVGSYVFFGSYEQDNDIDNGKEDIEWLVLAKEEGRILLISKYGLEERGFHKSRGAVTWETCELREWLNSTFWDTAFTDEEKYMIPEVTVKAYRNPHESYGHSPGNDTTDHVFLLSVTEALQYFNNADAMECNVTNYVVKHDKAGFYDRRNSTEPSYWWLRTPGYSRFFATLVLLNGSINEYGHLVNSNGVAVRPVIWVNIGS